MPEGMIRSWRNDIRQTIKNLKWQRREEKGLIEADAGKDLGFMEVHD
ncbi:hypothetical protein ACTRXD_13790 [Nitrospira sp. T9]